MLNRAVCTIVTKSHLPFARALAKNLAQFNSDIVLYVLLADRVDGYFDPDQEPFKIIFLEDLPDQKTVQNMCFYYTAFELCCALRGALHEYIYENYLADIWLFLDSDILIFNSLQEVFQQLETTSILLTPHILKPVQPDYVNLLEVSILASGNYNAGFLGLRRTDETRKFIDWFKHRLIHYGFARRGYGMLQYLFVDQLWLNFVPQFFKEVQLLTHPGANVGYWNLISRSLTKEGQTYFVDEYPLLFVHFSGWDILQPHQLSKHFPCDCSVDHWIELAEQYRQVLLTSRYENDRIMPYAFNAFTDGQNITSEIRLMFYRHLEEGIWSQENPFIHPEYFLEKNKLKNPSQKKKLRNQNAVLQKILKKMASTCDRLAAML